MDEIGPFLVTFTLPLKPAIRKTDRPAVLPERLKHPAGCRGFHASIDERRFIPPPGCVTPMNRIEVRFFIAFAQQQNFGTRCDVVTADRFGVIGDIPLGLFGKIR